MPLTLKQHELHQDVLQQNETADLVTSQVNFGMAYVREARSAYESGSGDYAEVARKIAVNSYAAALRFSARLPSDLEPALLHRIEELESELDQLLNSVAQTSLRSIA